MQACLSVQGITKTFGRFVALNNVSFSVCEKEFVCLLGPSGCGNTTLLRVIAGLEQQNAGEIKLNGRDISRLPPAERNFGMVFQSYALFPNLTAFENVSYGLQSRWLAKDEIAAKAKDVLAMVGLEQEKGKYPAQLSGGQQQRIALARALATSPEFLLLDEPLSALDAKVRLKLRQEIKELQRTLGITTIMVTHDQEEALTMADRIVVMNNSQVEQIGTPIEIYERPGTPFIADFIGAVNFISGSRLCHEKYADQLLAIRPEHVCLTGGNTPNGLRAMVKEVEFRGSFFRLTLQLAEESLLQGNSLLIADVSANLMASIQITKDMLITLELPEHRLIRYEWERRLHTMAG